MSILDIPIFADTYWAPIVLVPLAAAIYGYRKGVLGFVLDATADFAADRDNLELPCWQPAQIDGLVFGVFANLAVSSLVILPL